MARLRCPQCKFLGHQLGRCPLSIQPITTAQSMGGSEEKRTNARYVLSVLNNSRRIQKRTRRVGQRMKQMIARARSQTEETVNQERNAVNVLADDGRV